MSTPMRTVTVTGRGTAPAVPDAAVVRLAAAYRAPDVAGALAGLDAASGTAGAVARRFTQAARIASTDLSVWPAYDQQGVAAGFDARHGLRVVVEDLSAAGALLSALAVEVGDALRVEGVALEVTDAAAAERDAREAAYADARHRADHLAALAGATVAEVVAVVEGGPGGLFGEVPLPRAQLAKDVGLEPGERAISATLTVTFALSG